MRHLRSTTAAALLVLGMSACAEEGLDRSAADPATGTPRAPDSVASPRQIAAEDFDPALFEDSINIDHEWYPLTPGTRLFYRGSSVDEGEPVHHTVDVIVTDLIKEIDGVRNVVVWERDYTEGELVETELAFFAQDKDGNVWHMGEYPEEYEDGKFVAAPTWVHGLAGATAGITIPSEPRTGTPDFAQGYAPPPLNWVDRGRVYRTGHSVCVPVGCYEDVVVIEEFETGLPDAFQDKFYAPGIGVARVGWRGAKDESKEVLELVEVTRLNGAELAEVRTMARQLEDRAYRISKEVYGRTQRAEPAG